MKELGIFMSELHERKRACHAAILQSELVTCIEMQMCKPFSTNVRQSVAAVSNSLQCAAAHFAVIKNIIRIIGLF